MTELSVGGFIVTVVIIVIVVLVLLALFGRR